MRGHCNGGPGRSDVRASLKTYLVSDKTSRPSSSLKTGTVAFMSDSEDPARWLSVIKSHELWTLPTRLEMMWHRAAFSEATGVHLGF